MSINFAGNNYDNESVMTINDLHCVFNMPKALKTESKEGNEVCQGLPPYAPRKAFKVDEYNSPTSWMHGSSLANSYFVPIDAESGMWLDFNKNAFHKHDVAILISVQGVNPLDGQSMVDGAMHLRQYQSKCPKHDKEFGADRYCDSCGYKWVPQNYLCTTGTPRGLLWLDGFLASDGVVRQYYFTEEEAKGVAHQVIGAEKKVYSIGIAFYLSKTPKPEVPDHNILRSMGSWSFNSQNMLYGQTKNLNMYDSGCATYSCDVSLSLQGSMSSSSKLEKSIKKSKRRSAGGGQSVGQHVNSVSKDFDVRDFDTQDESPVKTLEIGAGAKINQTVYKDPKELDYWEEKPAGILYINYTPSEQAEEIIKKGKKDLTKKGESWMAGLNTGK
jgi:hypothetical protein